MVDCELCKAEKLTRWYSSNDSFWIADCKTCGLNHPMIVYRLHGKEPPEELKREMLWMARRLFGENIGFRGYMRSLKGHWHQHLVMR